MKTTLYTLLLALLLALVQATPVLRGLKSCNAGCTATFTACIKAPDAVKSVCRQAKKECQAVCKSNKPVVEEEEEEEEAEEEEEEAEEDMKAICVEACAKEKNACQKAVKGKEKQKCIPPFKACKAVC